LFTAGTFGVPSPLPTLTIPTPGGGTLKLDYRFELLNFGFDIVPSDQTFDGFADPFQLADDQGALYAQVQLDLKGSAPTAWSDRLIVYAWIQCQLSQSPPGTLSFSVVSTQVRMDKVSNSSLYHILDMLLTGYLTNAVGTIKLPLGISVGALGEIKIAGLRLHLDSIDAYGTIG
jgi:hypothetical protein